MKSYVPFSLSSRGTFGKSVGIWWAGEVVWCGRGRACDEKYIPVSLREETKRYEELRPLQSVFADIARHLRKESREGDLIVILGAGNVWEIGRDLVGG